MLIIGAAGFWMRLLLMKEVRDNTPFDYFISGASAGDPDRRLSQQFPAHGRHRGQNFFVGLVTSQWTNLPTDAMLLIHLWLVAVLMVSLPFSQLLHMAGVFDKIPGTLAGARQENPPGDR